MARWWQIWSWPSPGGHGKPVHPDEWQQPAPGDLAQPHPYQATPTLWRRPFPAGGTPSRWYTSRVPLVHGQDCHIGGSALLNRIPGLPPKTVRPAFTGPYERKLMRSFRGRNQAIYQPLQMLPVVKRSQPQAVRHSQAPRLRPALVGPQQRFSAVPDDQLMANARARANGRLGARTG